MVSKNTENAIARFNAVMDKLKELHDGKMRRYSADVPYGNIKKCSELGIAPYLGCFIRMTDKWERIQNMLKNPELDGPNNSEPIIETLQDLAVYCVIMTTLMEDDAAPGPVGKGRGNGVSITEMWIDEEEKIVMRNPVYGDPEQPEDFFMRHGGPGGEPPEVAGIDYEGESILSEPIDHVETMSRCSKP